MATRARTSLGTILKLVFLSDSAGRLKFGARNFAWFPVPQEMVNSGPALFCSTGSEEFTDSERALSESREMGVGRYAFSPSGFTNCNDAEFIQ